MKTVGQIMLCVLTAAILLMPAAMSMHQTVRYTDISESKQNGSLAGGDQVDQYQTNWDDRLYYFFNDNDNCTIAQSFKPTLKTLTRVELVLAKVGFRHCVSTVSIRKERYGDDLTSAPLNMSNLTNNPRGHMFDFPDITVEPDTTYYIVIPLPKNTNHVNAIMWAGTVEDLYERGAFWYYDDKVGWRPEYRYSDAAFATYGMSNTKPEAPTILGPQEGKIGVSYEFTFEATDDEGDNLYYWIEWGDNTSDEWIGPYPSGEKINITHTWEEKNEYIVRAKVKDTENAESDWSTHKVIMPLSHDTLLQRLIKWLFTGFFSLP